MTKQAYIEVFCRKADTETFTRLGFDSVPQPGTIGTRMVHESPNSALVATLIQIGVRGLAFTARVVETANYVGMLMAGDGTRFVAVPTAGDCLEPLTRVAEDYRLHGHHTAEEYYAVRAAFRQLMSNEEVSL